MKEIKREFVIILVLILQSQVFRPMPIILVHAGEEGNIKIINHTRDTPNPIYVDQTIIVGDDEERVIENTVIFIDGNIIVRNNAKLMIRNATVIVNNTYFQRYWIYVLNNSTLEVSDSKITHNYVLKDPPVMFVQHNAKIIMNNSISDWRIVVEEGAEAVLSSSVLPILSWDPANSIFGPLEVTIIDSYIEHLMELRFPREISEQVDLVGLKPGKIECLDLESGNSFLRVKNTWLGLGWSVSLPAHYEAQSKNRIVIRDSYLYQLWLAFPSNSKVKISNLKPGLFSSWSLYENAQLNNVTYNVTLVNTRIEIWKLSFYGEGEIENVEVFTLDTSSNENAVILVSNSNIGQYHNRGAKYAKFSNTTITERMRFVSWEGGAGVPGLIHRGKSTIEFENSIINAPYIEIANHDAFITGTVSILTPLDNILWHSGTIIREYLLVVRDGQGSPLPDIPLRLIDWKGTIIWNGSTNQWGKALFNITFTEENYTKEWKLIAELSGMNISKEIGFLTSTPIVLTLHKLTSSISDIEVLILRPLIAVTVIIVIIVGYLTVRVRRKPKT